MIKIREACLMISKARLLSGSGDKGVAESLSTENDTPRRKSFD